MKKVLNNILNFSYNTLLVFTIICFSISLIGATFFCVNRSYNYLNPLILILGSIIYLLLIIKLYKFVINLDDKYKKIICAILLILQAILLLVSSFIISSVPTVDLVHILTGINSLNHEGILINNEYFSVYPNNRFLLVILYNIQKINPNYSHTLFSFVSSLSITIMSFFTYKTVKKISNNINKGLICLFVCVFSPIFYLYVSYYYTDILMLPFASILLYLIINNDCNNSFKKDIIYSLLIGVVSVLGYKIRAVSIFLLIAYFVYLIFMKKIKKLLRTGIPIIIAAILTLFCLNKLEDNFFKEIDKNKEFPMTHWVMMGLNEEHSGYYSQDDYNLSSSAFDVNERIDLNILEIKNRLSDLGPIGLIKLFCSKLVTVWGKGDYSYQKYLGLVNDYNVSYKYLIEDKNIVINYLLQISKIGILVLVIISLIKLLKENKKSMLAISIFGATLFYLIWEVCPRYGLSFLPWLIILSSYSFDFINLKSTKVVSNNWFKYIILTVTLILFILGFSKYTSPTLKNNVVAHDTTKKIEYVSLNKETTILQSLDLNSKFNLIKLKFNVSDTIDNELYKLELLNSEGKSLFSKMFSIDIINENGYTTFDLDKSYSKGKYYIKLSTESEKTLNVILSKKKEFDFYPQGGLKINDGEQTGDLMFEIINKEKRGTYTHIGYIFLMFLTFGIEYIVLFRRKEEVNEEK